MEKRKIYKAKPLQHTSETPWIRGNYTQENKKDLIIAAGKMYEVDIKTLCLLSTAKDRRGILVAENDLIAVGKGTAMGHPEVRDGLYRVKQEGGVFTLVPEWGNGTACGLLLPEMMEVLGNAIDDEEQRKEGKNIEGALDGLKALERSLRDSVDTFRLISEEDVKQAENAITALEILLSI